MPTSALKGLAALQSLSTLELDGTQIDDDLDSLKAAQSLRILVRWGTAPPDLKKLAELRQLKRLHFPHLKDLDAGEVAAFQQINPGCQIAVDSG